MSESVLESPRLIQGGLAVDDRGQVMFVNDFNFDRVQRFYMVSNHKQGFVRAWHAHRLEAKYVFVSAGAAKIGAVPINNWENPDKDARVYSYILSAQKPAVLYIPAGYANGFMSLTPDTSIIFFSTATMNEATQDDIRYDARHWDIWNVEER